MRVFFPNGMFTFLGYRGKKFSSPRGEVVGGLNLPHNLGCSSISSDIRHVSIAASSSGPLPPPLPIARSVTIAQVVSPGLGNPNEPSFLGGLQEYFRTALRLVKRGDVLTIPTEVDPLAIYTATAIRDIPYTGDGGL